MLFLLCMFARRQNSKVSLQTSACVNLMNCSAYLHGGSTLFQNYSSGQQYKAFYNLMCIWTQAILGFSKNMEQAEIPFLNLIPL